MSSCQLLARCADGSAASLSWRESQPLVSSAWLLVQTLGHRLQLAVLGDSDGGDWVTILDVWSYAYCKVETYDLVNSSLQVCLRVFHCGTLRLGISEIIVLGDRFCLSDRALHVVDDHLKKFPILFGVDGELELTVFHLELCQIGRPSRWLAVSPF
jgi:hypothetical protein